MGKQLFGKAEEFDLRHSKCKVRVKQAKNMHICPLDNRKMSKSPFNIIYIMRTTLFIVTLHK